MGVLHAVADHNPERAAEYAARFGCKAHDVDSMIADAQVDGVVVALPPEHHVEVALKALRARKHLLVEKPMALEIAGAEAIVAEAARAGVVAMTGHLLRFTPAFEALEELVASGRLGQVRYVYSTRIGLGKFFQNTDALWDIAPHDLSILLAITGEEPQEVRLEGAAMLSDAPDFAHLHMSFPSGCRSHTFISRLAPRRERKFTVIGDKAMAVVDDLESPDRKLAVYDHRIWSDDGGIRFESVDPEFLPLRDAMPLTTELGHFIDCAETGRSPKSSVAEGLAVLRVLAAGDTQKARLRRHKADTPAS